MGNKLGITEGVWEQNHSIIYIDNNSSSIYPYYECGGFGSEKEANAKLIADAGTTANKCGKLPSQLLQENEEMKAMLEKVKDKVLRRDLSLEIEQILTKINQ